MYFEYDIRLYTHLFQKEYLFPQDSMNTTTLVSDQNDINSSRSEKEQNSMNQSTTELDQNEMKSSITEINTNEMDTSTAEIDQCEMDSSTTEIDQNEMDNLSDDLTCNLDDKGETLPVEETPAVGVYTHMLEGYNQLLHSKLHDQRKQRQFCDLELRTESGTSVWVHGCVMSAFSPKIASMIFDLDSLISCATAWFYSFYSYSFTPIIAS